MTNAAADSGHDADAVGGFHQLLQVSVRGAEVDVAVIEADAIKPVDAVEPIDNYDMFRLVLALAPEEVTLAGDAASGYTMSIPLDNTSDRDVRIMMSCASAMTGGCSTRS